MCICVCWDWLCDVWVDIKKKKAQHTYIGSLTRHEHTELGMYRHPRLAKLFLLKFRYESKCSHSLSYITNFQCTLSSLLVEHRIKIKLMLGQFHLRKLLVLPLVQTVPVLVFECNILSNGFGELLYTYVIFSRTCAFFFSITLLACIWNSAYL